MAGLRLDELSRQELTSGGRRTEPLAPFWHQLLRRCQLAVGWKLLPNAAMPPGRTCTGPLIDSRALPGLWFSKRLRREARHGPARKLSGNGNQASGATQTANDFLLQLGLAGGDHVESSPSTLLGNKPLSAPQVHRTSLAGWRCSSMASSPPPHCRGQPRPTAHTSPHLCSVRLRLRRPLSLVSGAVAVPAGRHNVVLTVLAAFAVGGQMLGRAP